MPSSCPCGASVCANHNRGYFVRAEPSPSLRAVVFLWPRRGKRMWTWCPVIDGDPKDHGTVMGHYDTLPLAYADARAYTRGEYGTVLDA